MVLRRVGWQVAIGAALGIIASLWVSPLATTLLYGVQPQDPTTLGAGAFLLVASSVMAGWLPARSASRADPALVLRDA
jgi:ABC-type antimicrobial peptide transport system permease subunit